MRLILIPLALLFALTSPSLAQSAGKDAKLWNSKSAAKKADAPVARSKDRAGGRKPCPEYGAGFYRLDGSDTCIRIGGSIGVDVGTTGVR